MGDMAMDVALDMLATLMEPVMLMADMAPATLTLMVIAVTTTEDTDTVISVVTLMPVLATMADILMLMANKLRNNHPSTNTPIHHLSRNMLHAVSFKKSF